MNFISAAVILLSSPLHEVQSQLLLSRLMDRAESILNSYSGMFQNQTGLNTWFVTHIDPW
jgi:hypothetical protein